MQTSELKDYTSIETFVSQLNKVFEKITLLVNIEHFTTDGLNPEEQHEMVKRADQEIKQSENVLENMQMIARNLIENLKTSNINEKQKEEDEQKRVELEKLVGAMNSKWAETRAYIDNLAVSLERSCAQRKATEELATLRDVHEGYQRYIKNAEPLSSDDPQKLNLQLETNKVIIFCFLIIIS